MFTVQCNTFLHCTVNHTRHKQDWITMQPHCQTVFNDIFQLTILMFTTSVKHKRRAPGWWSFWTETCSSILMLILTFFLQYLIVQRWIINERFSSYRPYNIDICILTLLFNRRYVDRPERCSSRVTRLYEMSTEPARDTGQGRCT